MVKQQTQFIDVLGQMDKKDLPKTRDEFIDFLEHYLDEINENKYFTISEFLKKYKDGQD